MLTGLESAVLPEDAVEVGRILDAWGIKGWFRVLSHSSDPAALFAAKQWYLLPSEKGAKTFSGVGKLEIAQAKVHSGSVVASAQGVLDRNAAEALRGARIFVPRTAFPASAPDEYYWVDLIGLAVENREGQSMGTVRDLMETGPQTVLVLDYEADGKPCERMIPFVSAFVDKVDMVARKILVDWQADY
jgi:16S rRNA processing protein RimM